MAGFISVVPRLGIGWLAAPFEVMILILYPIPWFGTWRSGIRPRLQGGRQGGRPRGTGPRKSILLLLYAHHCRAEYAELGSVSAGSLAGSWHPS